MYNCIWMYSHVYLISHPRVYAFAESPAVGVCHADYALDRSTTLYYELLLFTRLTFITYSTDYALDHSVLCLYRILLFLQNFTRPTMYSTILSYSMRLYFTVNKFCIFQNLIQYPRLSMH